MPAGTADRELLAVACVLGLPPLLGVPGLPAKLWLPASGSPKLFRGFSSKRLLGALPGVRGGELTRRSSRCRWPRGSSS